MRSIYILLSLFLFLPGITMAQGPVITVESVAGACNGNNGAIEVNASGGSAPYQFAWSNGFSGPAIFNLSPGSYTVTVTDAGNQTATQTVEVPTADSLQVQLLLTKALCPGVNNGTATAQVFPPGGNYTYQWSPNLGNGVQITGLAAGTTVCVTVTDQNSGCVGVACGAILAHEQIKVRLDSIDPSCNGLSTGSAIAIASSGQAPYSFMWNAPNPVFNTDTSSTISGLAPGFYTVSVTDNRGCTTIGGASISDTLGPDAHFNMDLSDCDADSNKITFTLTDSSSIPAPGVIVSWNWLVTWSNGFSTFNTQGPHVLMLPGGESGIIRLAVASNTGCVDTFEMAFTLPVPPNIDIMVSPSDSACPGDPVFLTVTGGDTTLTYSWTPTTALDLSGFPFVAVANGQVTTTYLVTAADGFCEDTDTVTIFRAPLIQIAAAGDSLFSCSDSLFLAIENPAGFTDVQWFYCDGTPIDPALALALPPDTALCIYVTGVDVQFGCPSSDTALLLNTVTDVAIQLLPGSNCETDTIYATAVNNQSGDLLTYQWSVNNPLVQIIGNGQDTAGFFGPAGAYMITLIVRNQFGCTDTLTADLIILPADTISPGDIQIDLCNGLSVTFFNNSGYPGVWDFGDNTTGTLDTVTHLYDAAGTYTIKFTPNDPCVEPFQQEIMVSSDSTLTAAISFSVRSCDSDSNLVKIALNDNSSVLPPADFLSWNWTVIGNNDTLTFNTMGPHILTYPGGTILDIRLIVTTNTGCVDTAYRLDTLPFPPVFSIAVSPSDTACAGDPVTLTVTGDSTYSYMWSPLSGLDLSGFPFIAVATGTVTTTYSLVGGFDMCYDTQQVTIFRAPTIRIAAMGDSLISCADSVLVMIEDPAGFTDVAWFFCDGTPFDPAVPLQLPPDSALCIYVNGVDIQFGCPSSDTAQVLNTSLDVEIKAQPGANCEGDTVFLEAINNHTGDILTYQWSVNSPLVQVLNADQPIAGFIGPNGTYIVTLIVRNQNDCTDTLTTTLTIIPVDILEADNFVIDLCQGLQVTLINNSGYTGIWDLGDGNTSTEDSLVHIYSAPGTYIVKFQPDADCVTDFVQEIEVSADPHVQADFSVEIDDCFLEAQLTFNDETQHLDSLLSWAWTFTPPGSTANVPNPSVVFTTEDSVLVKLVVTDVNGCMDSIERLIPIDIVRDTLVDTLTICSGQSVALNPDFNPNYDYLWTSQPADPTLDPTAGNPVVSPVTPTVYHVTISNGLCTVQDSVWVLLQPGDQITAAGDTTICEDGSVIISVLSTTNPDFQWSDTPDFSNILGAMDILSVTPAPGANWYYVRTLDPVCPGVDSVLVENRKIAIAYDSLRVLCEESPLMLQITNLHPGDTLSFSWNNGLPPVADPIVTPGVSTTYTATVTNQFGCTEVAVIRVEVAILNVDVFIAGADTIAIGDTAVLVATPFGGTGYTYQWSPAVLEPSNQDTVLVTPAQTTTYTVIVTDTLTGCTAEASVVVTVLDIPCEPPYIFIPTAFSPNGDGFNDFFRARTTNVTELFFIVYNRWGEKVYETTEVQHQGWDGTVRGKLAPPDSYGYYIRAVCPGQEVYESKGNVTLLR